MTQQRKPNVIIKGIQRLSSGCLALIATAFLIIVVVFLALEVKIQGMSMLVISICALAVLIYFWKKLGKRITSNSHAFKVILYDFFRIVVVFVVFGVIVNILMRNAGYTIKKEEVVKETEVIKEESTTPDTQKDTRKYVINKQRWRSFDGKTYQMDFKVAQDAIQNSKRNRLGYRITNGFSWGSFYKDMAENDKLLLEHLYTSFSRFQSKHKMSRKRFAEFIITGIQDIPYNYIKSGACNGREDHPCVGNIKLGIFAPAEFTANLTGDCDSRTVLLFVLLSKFTYDVAILNSDHYRHSVLGINIPARGKYKTYNRKKYYFVETTAKGCPIGYLPKDVGNVRYWNFVLVN